jgi:hypothetical protein
MNFTFVSEPSLNFFGKSKATFPKYVPLIETLSVPYEASGDSSLAPNNLTTSLAVPGVYKMQGSAQVYLF